MLKPWDTSVKSIVPRNSKQYFLNEQVKLYLKLDKKPLACYVDLGKSFRTEPEMSVVKVGDETIKLYSKINCGLGPYMQI